MDLGTQISLDIVVSLISVVIGAVVSEMSLYVNSECAPLINAINARAQTQAFKDVMV